MIVLVVTALEVENDNGEPPQGTLERLREEYGLGTRVSDQEIFVAICRSGCGSFDPVETGYRLWFNYRRFLEEGGAFHLPYRLHRAFERRDPYLVELARRA